MFGKEKTVLSQTPTGGNISKNKTKVFLYTEKESDFVTVENLCGLSLSEANKILAKDGFSIALSGIKNAALAEGATVTAQSLPPGSVVRRGEKITLEIVYCDFED